MSFDINLIQEPKVTHVYGTASNWSFVQNPLLFKFQRKDYTIISITHIGGGLQQCQVIGNPVSVNSGDIVYYGNSVGFQTGSYQVSSVDYTNRYIVLDTGLTTFGPLGFINDTTNIQNYSCYMDIYEWDSSGNPGRTIAFAKFYDDATGLITADLREFLAPEMNLNDWTNFFGVAQQHPNMDISYSFKFKPDFIHPTISVSSWTDFNTQYWAFKGSAQLGDEFGQNARRYMTYPPDSSGNEDSMMDFNTMFEEPYYFDGYPWLLSFIYSNKLTDNYIDRHIQWLDINDNSVDTEKTDRIPSNIFPHGCVITARGQLAFTNTANAYYDDVKGFYIWLEDSETTIASENGGGGSGTGTGGGGTDFSLIEDDYVDSGYFAP